MPRKKQPARKPSDTKQTIEQRNYEFLAPILNNEATRKRIERVSYFFETVDGDTGEKVFCFRYGGGGLPGVVALEFYAHGLADWSIATASRILREVKAEIRQHEAGFVEDGTDSDRDRATQKMARRLVPLFIEMIEGKMFSLMGEAEAEAECFIKSSCLKIVGINPNAHIEELVKEMAAERKRFLRKSVARFGSPHWENLKPLYDDLLPKANQARGLYEHSKQNPNWRAIIKAGFPEFEEDQIALLDKHADVTRLPEQARPAAANNNEDYSQPASMALEAAARLCGMKPFGLGTRRIRELMKDSADARERRHERHRAAVMRALEKNKPTDLDTVH